MEKLDEAIKTCPTCSRNYRIARMERYCPNCASVLWIEYNEVSEEIQKTSIFFRTFKSFLKAF